MRQGDTAASFRGEERSQQPESLKAAYASGCLSPSSHREVPLEDSSSEQGDVGFGNGHAYLAVAGEAFVLFFLCCIKVFVFLSL